MTEQDHNNPSAENQDGAGKLDDEFIPDDARPLCPNCLKPCNPLQNYCDNCDSNEVVNPLASYMPFVRLRFVYGFFGKMWRTIWYDQETSIIHRLLCLLLIILFAPVLLIIGLPLLLIGKIPEPTLRKITVVAFYIIAVLLLMIFLYFNLLRGAISPLDIR